MALTSCPDCGREVSDRAPACPNCGAPIAAPPPSTASVPQRVITSEDSFLTRNRGCGDILLYGPLILLVMLVFMGSCPA